MYVCIEFRIQQVALHVCVRVSERVNERKELSACMPFMHVRERVSVYVCPCVCRERENFRHFAYT